MKAVYATVITLFILLQVAELRAQKPSPIKIGEKVPNVYIAQILRYSKKSARLADFRGKALILDFWFTNCGSCLDAIPHLDSIQNKYKKDLQVLMVTFQNAKLVTKLFQRERYRNIKLPTVINDTAALFYLFPHLEDPHQVWIDKNGIVRAITDGRSTTEENIKKLIAGQKLNLEEKATMADPTLALGKNPMILNEYEKNKDLLMYYSYLSKYRKEFTGGADIRIDKEKNTTFLSFRNIYFGDLYNYAYRAIGDPNNRKLTLIRNDSKPYSSYDHSETDNNFFCYDAIVRDTSLSRSLQYMREELDHCFGIKSSSQKRIMQCLVLKEKGTSRSYQTPMSNEEHDKYLKADTLIVQNVPLHLFILGLNEGEKFPMLVINETNFKGRATFKMLNKPSDIPAMAESLHPYGLDLSVESREIDVIVLEDAKN